MISTAIFVFFALAFCAILYSEKWFKKPPSEGWTLVLGLPWCVLISFGTTWGFITPPPYPAIRIPATSFFGEWLVLVVLVAVPLSLAACFKVANLRGYREGRMQGLMERGTTLLEVSARGKPIHIAFYEPPWSELKVGMEIMNCGDYYIIESVQPLNGLLYLQAKGKTVETS